jgi:hypothetical protein
MVNATIRTMSPNSSIASAFSARLIVCERSGEWSAALRLELANSGVRVWECRRIAEAWAALAEMPCAFVVVEATRTNLDDLIERLDRLRRDLPDARAAVVADRGLAAYRWLLREVGAVHFLVSTRQLPSLARLVVRHLANVPMPQQTLVERIWASLPWPERGM